MIASQKEVILSPIKAAYSLRFFTSLLLHVEEKPEKQVYTALAKITLADLPG